MFFFHKLQCQLNFNLNYTQVNIQMEKKRLDKDENGDTYMTNKNISICIENSGRYQTPQLNDALELHYCGFSNIGDLSPFTNVNTLYLNNNVIEHIENLQHCQKLVTLNLNNNRIRKISNLETLHELKILDISYNKLETIAGVQDLKALQVFNVSNNLLSSVKAIEAISQTKTVTSLNFSNNPLPADASIHEVLSSLPCLLTLYLKDTQFCRGTANYRKETICAVKSLTFLDERPITKTERMIVEAWKEGGAIRQRQVRKLIQESNEEKNKKILQEMLERSEKITKLRDDLYKELTVSEREELECLKRAKSEVKEDIEIKKINIQIEELEMFLELFRQNVQAMNVGEKKQVPRFLNEKVQENAIYIYGVSQDQIPKIKEAYYPEETRPLIAVDFTLPEEKRWAMEYDNILQEVIIQYQKDMDYIVPVFNTRVHKFDMETRRKARRFGREEVEEKYKEPKQSFEGITNELDEID